MSWHEFRVVRAMRHNDHPTYQGCHNILDQYQAMIWGPIIAHYYRVNRDSGSFNRTQDALLQADEDADITLSYLMIKRLHYGSPFEIVGLISLSTSAAASAGYAFLDLRNRYWDSNVHKQLRKKQLKFMDDRDYAEIAPLLRLDDVSPLGSTSQRTMRKVPENLRALRSHLLRADAAIASGTMDLDVAEVDGSSEPPRN
jgi:hypothetical protein